MAKTTPPYKKLFRFFLMFSIPQKRRSQLEQADIVAEFSQATEQAFLAVMVAMMPTALVPIAVAFEIALNAVEKHLASEDSRSAS